MALFHYANRMNKLFVEVEEPPSNCFGGRETRQTQIRGKARACSLSFLICFCFLGCRDPRNRSPKKVGDIF